jgi:hypothetical protein
VCVYTGIGHGGLEWSIVLCVRVILRQLNFKAKETVKDPRF